MFIKKWLFQNYFLIKNKLLYIVKKQNDKSLAFPPPIILSAIYTVQLQRGQRSPLPFVPTTIPAWTWAKDELPNKKNFKNKIKKEMQMSE